MLNNRKYINLLEEGNESLKRKVGLLKDLKEFYRRKNIELQADIEVKENSVCNLLEANKELSLSNNYLENKIKLLEQVWERNEIDWSKVPVGTKVLVSDNENNWYEHLFIDYRNDEELKFRAMDIKHKQLHNWKYCKLAEKPKDEVTFDDIDKEMKKYCDEHNESEICSKRCDSCGMKYILDNYNVTRKDNK